MITPINRDEIFSDVQNLIQTDSMRDQEFFFSPQGHNDF